MLVGETSIDFKIVRGIPSQARWSTRKKFTTCNCVRNYWGHQQLRGQHLQQQGSNLVCIVPYIHSMHWGAIGWGLIGLDQKLNRFNFFGGCIYLYLVDGGVMYYLLGQRVTEPGGRMDLKEILELTKSLQSWRPVELTTEFYFTMTVPFCSTCCDWHPFVENHSQTDEY